MPDRQPLSTHNATDATHLLQQLQVHRLELERQNEELRLARAEVEAGLHKYYQLYDFAPVGYCTVDQDGMVRESNLAGALLLGVDRARLLGHPFNHFITVASQQALRRFFAEISRDDEQSRKASVELIVADEAGGERHLYVEGSAFQTEQGLRHCRVAMMDITQSKRNSQELEHYRYHLEELVQQRTSELEQANARLKEQAENLASIYQALHSIGLVVCTLEEGDARIDIFSAGAENLFGHRPDEMLGQSLGLIFASEAMASLSLQVRRWRRGMAVQSLNTTLVRKSGEHFPAVVCIHPFARRDGIFTKVVAGFRDITELIEAQNELQAMNSDLEQRVAARTSELHESNVALTVLLKKREEDRKLLGEQVLSNTAHLVEPVLDRLRRTGLNDEQRTLVDILAANIDEVASPFANHLSSKLNRLTPAEIQVANLVKLGKRTKEIAEIMRLSPGTISIHRKNIRRKLELTHQKANLQTMLANND